MTRYVCSWCGRKQEGVNLSSCADCTGPVRYANLLADQLDATRDRLRKACGKALAETLLNQPTAYSALPRREPPRMAQPTGPLPPPIPRKPKPLVLRSPPPSGLAPE